jgi:hypothetical protein
MRGEKIVELSIESKKIVSIESYQRNMQGRAGRFNGNLWWLAVGG